MDGDFPPVFITTVSTTSNEKLQAKFSPYADMDTENSGNPPGAQTDCCKEKPQIKEHHTKKSKFRPVKLATAESLVRYVKVTPMTRIAHAANSKRSSQKEKPRLSWVPTAREFGLQIYGKGGAFHPPSFSGLPTERPDWTATLHDMTKDLIHNRMTICRDIRKVPMDNSVPVRIAEQPTLIETLAELPFHTLLVKWRLSFNFPAYTPRIVFGILSRFGRIDQMGTFSHNSAFVAFHFEYHACRAIMAKLVGFSYCPLIISWMFTERYKYGRADASDVKREDLLLSDGRLERNTKRHVAQIKRDFWRKAAALSYDVSTFRP